MNIKTIKIKEIKADIDYDIENPFFEESNNIYDIETPIKAWIEERKKYPLTTWIDKITYIADKYGNITRAIIEYTEN